MIRRGLLLGLLALLLGGCGSQTAQNNTGNRHLRRERLDQAVLAYQSAQVTAPDVPVPYFNAGVAFLETQDYAKAEAALNQALMSADAALAADAHFALGEVHFRQGRYRLAADAYQKVLLRQPDDEDARYNMELALSLIPTPTQPPAPTPTDDNIESEQESTPTATPSPTRDNVPEENQATSTPTPQPPDEDNPPTQTPPNPPPDNDEGEDGAPSPMPLNEAEQLLNDAQQQQSILMPPEETAVFAGSVPEKDW
jgi:Ca-activated chloride channel homolog